MLTRAEWSRRKDKGNWTYSQYVRFWKNQHRPKPSPFPGYQSDADLLAEARRIVEGELTPSRQEIGRLRESETARFGQESQNIQGYAQASAELQRPIGPQVQAGYTQAAGQTADFAKGFSIGMQAELSGNTEAINAELAKHGAPAGQMLDPAKATMASDVLYGTSGAIPATSLAREGAAFGAAASFLPQTALERGRIDLANATRESTTRTKEFDRLIADLEARRPGLVSDALRELRGEQVQRRAAYTNEQYLLGKGGLEARETIADITGVDPVTGRPTAAAQTATEKAAAKKRAASQKGVNAREDAFAAARGGVFEDAKGFVSEKTNNDPLAGLPGHPAKVKVRTPYRQAYQSLWNQYAPTLLRYATPAGKSALKKRIKQMIDQALAAQGIVPPKRQPQPRRRRDVGKPRRG
jgi:hypothetical protein